VIGDRPGSSVSRSVARSVLGIAIIDSILPAIGMVVGAVVLVLSWQLLEFVIHENKE
jgi:hypothetical protein